MISTANITMQFAAKPLFENISVKFGDGNRYGLIGANGCGKSTFMKILDGSLTPTAGNVSITPNERVGRLSQDQFAYEQYSVIDTVLMGHEELWAVKQERERIYALPEMSEDDGMKVAELEVQFAEMNGYSAESRAGEILLGAGIDLDLHFEPRYRHHSLARNDVERAQVHDDYYLARPSLPERSLHPYGRYRLR